MGRWQMGDRRGLCTQIFNSDYNHNQTIKTVRCECRRLHLSVHRTGHLIVCTEQEARLPGFSFGIIMAMWSPATSVRLTMLQYICMCTVHIYMYTVLYHVLRTGGPERVRNSEE